MINDYKSKELIEIIEYIRQDQMKRFGTDKLYLPFEPRFPSDSTLLKKNLIKPTESTE